MWRLDASSWFRVRLVVFAICGLTVAGSAAAQSDPVAPTLIPLAGQLLTADGQPRTGEVLLVISLYEGREDPAPRWIEHQVVTLDAQGGYRVQFGATRDEGLPADLFTGTAATRWIGVGVEAEPEQPRVMLVSVPYAARAASAETIAGRSVSDFVLASSFKDDVRAALAETKDAAGEDGPVGTDAVSDNFLQKGLAGGITDSAVYETGGNVGIGTTTPQTLLHLRANLNLPAFRLENTEAAGATWQVTSANDGQLRFTEVGAATRLVVNKATGNMGIGTQTPQTLMHLRAGLNLPAFRLENTEAAGATWQVTSASDGQFRLTEVGAAARLIVEKSSGNVGIGTGAPTSKLHVVGNARLAGDVTVDGALASPTITALVSELAALTARVEKLESGEVVEADIPGTYELQLFGVELNGNPARVGMEQFGGRVTLNADGTGTITASGGNCQLTEGTPWVVACGTGTETEALTWRLENGMLITTGPDGEDSAATLAAGGRIAISGGITEFTPGAGFGILSIAIRLPDE